MTYTRLTSKDKTHQLQQAAAYMGQSVLLIRRVAYEEPEGQLSRKLMELTRRLQRSLVTLERYTKNFLDGDAQ